MKIYLRYVSLIGLLGCLPASFAQESISPLKSLEVVNILKQHNIAQVARLKVISVNESQQLAFKSNRKIFAYPIVGKIRNIGEKQSKAIASLLIRENNYNNVRIRCLNRFFHGIRFSQGTNKVEFAIGIPCNQVFVAYSLKGKIKIWGSVLSPVTVKKIIVNLRK